MKRSLVVISLMIASALVVLPSMAQQETMPVSYEFNGRRVSAESVNAITPEKIAAININKDTVEYNGVLHYGTIEITFKPDVTFISLADIIAIYNVTKSDVVICMIGDQFVKDNPEDVLLDEDQILSVELLSANSLASVSDSECDRKIDIIRVTPKPKIREH